MITTVILPNYSQSSQLSVIFFSGNAWANGSYSDNVSILNLPKGCGRGIPAPVLARQKIPTAFVLGQLICSSQNSRPRIFMKSCLAGKDRTGRSVFLTVIWSGNNLPSPESGENYTLGLSAEQIRTVTKETFVTDSEQDIALNHAINLINSPPMDSKSAIEDIWKKATKSSHYLHYASINMDGAGYLPDSQKNSGENFGDKFSSILRNAKGNALIAIIFFIILIFVLSHCASNSSTPKKETSSEQSPVHEKL